MKPRFFKFRTWLAFCLAVVLSIAMVTCTSVLAVQEALVVPNNILMLHSGQHFTGRIYQQGGGVFVETESGSRLYFQPQQVDFFCNSLAEAYWEKAARTRVSDIAGQKDLFYFCLENELFELAENQLAVLLELPVSRQEIYRLDRQLSTRLDLQEEQEAKLLAQAKTPIGRPTPLYPIKASSAQPGSPLKKVRRLGKDGSIRLVSYEEVPEFPAKASLKDQRGPSVEFGSEVPAGQKMTVLNGTFVPGWDMRVVKSMKPKSDSGFAANNIDAVARSEGASVLRPMPTIVQPVDDSGASEPKAIAPTSVQPDNEQLAAAIKRLPKSFVGHFRTRVERLLVNSCDRCHGVDDTVMPLMRRGRNEIIPTKMSHRNLYQFARYMNHDAPLESRLYEVLTESHADSVEPLLEKGSKAHQKFLTWLIELKPDASITDAVEQIRSQSIVPLEPERLPTENQVGGLAEKQEGEKAKLDVGAEGFEVPDLRLSPKQYRPKDAFDPEIFNQMHHPRG